MKWADIPKTDTRACPRCFETLPLDAEHFYFNRDGKPGTYCKPCHSMRTARYKRQSSGAPTKPSETQWLDDELDRQRARYGWQYPYILAAMEDEDARQGRADEVSERRHLKVRTAPRDPDLLRRMDDLRAGATVAL